MEGNRQYETLNAMRGVAAAAVVLYHSGKLLGVNVAPSGYLAVDVFFVLSGFVIAHAYDTRLNGGMSVRSFAWVRLARFYPLLLLGLAIGAVRAAIGMAIGSPTALSPSQYGISLLSSLLFLPAPVTATGELFALNVPLWTLFLELLVNLLYALLLRRLTTTWIACIAALGFALLLVAANAAGSDDVGASAGTAFGGIGRALFGFSAGLLIYRLRPAFPAVPWGLSLLLLGIALLLPVGGNWRLPFDIAFVLVAAPLFVIAGAQVNPPAKWLGVATYLGIASFVVYAIHVPLLGVAEAFNARFHIPALPLWVALIVLLAVSAPLIDRFYDRPFRRLLMGRRTQASTA